MRERTIAAREVPIDPIRCPKCNKRNLTLTGHVCREFTERLQDGQTVQQSFAEELERETHTIECNDCRIRWLIMTAEESALLLQNEELCDELITADPSFIEPANKLDC